MLHYSFSRASYLFYFPILPFVLQNFKIFPGQTPVLYIELFVKNGVRNTFPPLSFKQLQDVLLKM